MPAPPGRMWQYAGIFLVTTRVIRLQDLEAKIIGGTVLGTIELARESQTVISPGYREGVQPGKDQTGAFREH